MSEAVALLAKMTAGLSDVEKKQLAQLLLGDGGVIGLPKDPRFDMKLKEPVAPRPDKSKTVITEDFRVIKDEPSNHKTPVRGGKNTFVDEGEDKDDDDISLAYLPKNPTAKRPPAEFIDVVCEKCRKTKNIPKSLSTSYYVCERCVGK
jgi:hypothetical protein